MMFSVCFNGLSLVINTQSLNTITFYIPQSNVLCLTINIQGLHLKSSIFRLKDRSKSSKE